MPSAKQFLKHTDFHRGKKQASALQTHRVTPIKLSTTSQLCVCDLLAVCVRLLFCFSSVFLGFFCVTRVTKQRRNEKKLSIISELGTFYPFLLLSCLAILHTTQLKRRQTCFRFHLKEGTDITCTLFLFSLTCVWTCAWPNHVVAEYPSLPNQTPHQFCATVSHHHLSF